MIRRALLGLFWSLNPKSITTSNGPAVDLDHVRICNRRRVGLEWHSILSRSALLHTSFYPEVFQSQSRPINAAYLSIGRGPAHPRENASNPPHWPTSTTLSPLGDPPVCLANHIVISNDSDLALPVAEAKARIPVGLVNPSRNYTAGALQGNEHDGVGRHWWYRLTSADFTSHQLPDPCSGYSKPLGW